MKIKNVCLALLLTIWPFPLVKADRLQVVIVEGEVLASGSSGQIQALDFLERSETLILSPDSYLVLTDFAANIYEYRGRTSILLDTLSGRSRHSIAPMDPGLLYQDRTLTPFIDDSKCLIIASPFYFSSELTLEDSVTVSWLDLMSGEDRFLVVIENESGDRLLKKRTSEFEYSFSLRIPELAGKNIFFQIRPETKDTHCNPETRKITIQKVRSNDVHMESRSAAASVVKALYFETLGQVDAAERHYAQAAELAPDVDEYAIILSRFRSRRP